MIIQEDLKTALKSISADNLLAYFAYHKLDFADHFVTPLKSEFGNHAFELVEPYLKHLSSEQLNFDTPEEFFHKCPNTCTDDYRSCINTIFNIAERYGQFNSDYSYNFLRTRDIRIEIARLLWQNSVPAKREDNPLFSYLDMATASHEKYLRVAPNKEILDQLSLEYPLLNYYGKPDSLIAPMYSYGQIQGVQIYSKKYPRGLSLGGDSGILVLGDLQKAKKTNQLIIADTFKEGIFAYSATKNPTIVLFSYSKLSHVLRVLESEKKLQVVLISSENLKVYEDEENRDAYLYKRGVIKSANMSNRCALIPFNSMNSTKNFLKLNVDVAFAKMNKVNSFEHSIFRDPDKDIVM